MVSEERTEISLFDLRSGLPQKNNYKIPPDRSINSVDAKFTIVGANRSVLYAGLWLKKSGAKISGVTTLEEVVSDGKK